MNLTRPFAHPWLHLHPSGDPAEINDSNLGDLATAVLSSFNYL
jgi:hypothetical protein